ncbi:MAG: Ig-like domain-containing protein [Verrucomicrobiales bacterium]|nr:Ig-like domain-containing protein [Verrucomicrobiales bacterium]
MNRRSVLNGLVCGLLNLVVACPALAADGDVPIQAVAVSGGRVELRWPASAAAVLESSPALGTSALWATAPESVEDRTGFRVVTVTPAGGARFFRLALRGPNLVRVVATSPSSGESGVAVTRETVFRLSGPLASDEVVTTGDLSVTAGGRSILSRVEVGSDRKTLTLFYLENLPSSAKATVRLRGDSLRDTTGQAIDGDGDGVAGGTAVVEFVTSGTVAVPGTAVEGWVYASERRSDGSNRPLAGATVTVDGAEESLRVVTDASGYFRLEPSPAGRFFVHVDGRTAVGSQWPGGAYYPFVGKAWEAVAGRTNNRAGGTGEIFLPLISADTLKVISATNDTVIGLPSSVVATNPAMAGVRITVPPDALFSENGVRGGRVGLAPVVADRLPEPLPPGLRFPLVITIQTDGPMNFDRPVPVRFPNLPDPATGLKLPPGAKSALWSFNHDTGRWEVQGLVTITADGEYAETDPGVGVRQPGWHGIAPGIGAGGPGDEDDDDDDNDDGDGPNCPNGAPPACCEPGGWDKLKKQCDQQKELTLNSIFDFGVDGLDFALEALPAGCLASGMFETGKTARDCVVVGQFTDNCADIASDNGIGFGLSCIPVVGGVLDLGWGGKQLIDNLIEFDECLDDIKAACGTASKASPHSEGGGRPSAAVVTQDPRVERIKDLLALQIELAESSSNLLARLYGAPVWSRATSPADLPLYQGLLSAISAALKAESPGGKTVTAAEREAVVMLVRPNGASESDLQALITRLEGFANGSLKTDVTTRNALIGAFDRYLDALDKALTDDWKDPFDGFRQILELVTSMYEPNPDTDSVSAQETPALAAISRHDAIEESEEPPGFPVGRHFYLLRDHDTGFVRRGRLNEQGRFDDLILRPDTLYSVAYFDPLTMRAGASFFRSGLLSAVALEIVIPTALLLPVRGSTELALRFPDHDIDGLPDLVEAVLGTSRDKADSDNDGLKDGQEVLMGSDPLDGVGVPVGVVAVVPTPGVPRGIAVEGGLALVAASNGLGIYDVSDVRSPFQISAIAEPATTVSLRGREAWVGWVGGVGRHDLTNPSIPVTVWHRSDVRTVVAISFLPEAGLVMADRRLLRLDARTGVTTGSVELPLPVDDVAVSGGRIYAVASGSLYVVDSGELGLRLAHTVDTTMTRGVGGRPLRLFGANPLLYGVRTVGFSVFETRQEDPPVLIQDHFTRQSGWRDLALHDADRGVAVVGPNSTEEGEHDVGLYDLRPAGTNAQFQATLPLPGGSGAAVELSRARAYVADEGAGLVILNYLPPDLGTNAPTLQLRLGGLDTLGPVEGGALVSIQATAVDDIAVRDVEFLADGVLVGRDDSYPYEVLVRAPLVTPANPSPVMVLRARATDTVGNAIQTSAMAVPVVVDATPPKVTAVEPPEGGVILANLITEVRVSFSEAVVGAEAAGSLTLLHSGPDQILGTPDDAPVAGTVTYDGSGPHLRFVASNPLTVGSYRGVLAAGLKDAAGNTRLKSFAWEFRTGPAPFPTVIAPFGPIVRVGGVVEEITAIFDQPVPKVFTDTYTWKLSRISTTEPATEISPLEVRLAADARTYTLRPPTPLGPGDYQVNGSGPNLPPAQWTFNLRTVPNEPVNVVNGQVQWKYPPGPLSNDVLVVNLPGKVVPLSNQALQRLEAWTDLQISDNFTAREPVEILGAVSMERNVVLGPGVMNVRGPLWLTASGASMRLRSQVLNLFGGGEVWGGLGFLDDLSVVVNQPASLLVISNTFVTSGNTTLTNPVGSLVNLGTLRRSGGTNLVRLEGARLRNDGRFEVQEGGVLVQFLENEGTIHLAPEARLVVSGRARGGVTSRILGTGGLEFGEWDWLRNRLVREADGEVRGEVGTTGPLWIHGGTVTLWKLAARENASTEIRQSAVLRVLGAAQMGSVGVSGGTLGFNGDALVTKLDLNQGGFVESAGQTRVTGEAWIRNGWLQGGGTIEFAGTTVMSNANQQSVLRVGGGVVRNTGTWRVEPNSDNGGSIEGSKTGPFGGGSFENAGQFEWLSANPLVIRAPFHNAGRVRFGAGTVTFDARNNLAGAYRPAIGGELNLAGTRLDYGTAGDLDLAAGTVSGTGAIFTVSQTGSSKVINRGTLQVGSPTGTLSINASGGVELTATSRVVATLGADGASRLESRSGAPGIRLGGVLEIRVASGFEPAIGQSYDLLALTFVGAGDVSGNFERVEVPDLGPDRRIVVEVQPRKVVARVVAP